MNAFVMSSTADCVSTLRWSRVFAGTLLKNSRIDSTYLLYVVIPKFGGIFVEKVTNANGTYLE